MEEGKTLAISGFDLSQGADFGLAGVEVKQFAVHAWSGTGEELVVVGDCAKSEALGGVEGVVVVDHAASGIVLIGFGEAAPPFW